MTEYPNDNWARISTGLLAIINRGETTLFDDRRALNVIFDGDPSKFDDQRVFQFQKFLFRETAVFPEIARMAPSCIRVSFKIFDEWDTGIEKLVKSALKTKDAKNLYRELRISQVSLGSEIILPRS